MKAIEEYVDKAERYKAADWSSDTSSHTTANQQCRNYIFINLLPIKSKRRQISTVQKNLEHRLQRLNCVVKQHTSACLGN